MSTKSLQEQLLSLKQKTEFKKAPAPKLKQPTPQPQKPPALKETIDLRSSAVRAKQDKAEQSKAQAKAQRHAARLKVRELIEKNRCNDDKAEIPHHFQCGTKIKRVFVNADQQAQLKTGALMVVIYGGRHQLLPATIAEQIHQLLPELPVITEFGSESELPDDYKDYTIPDDLMW